MWQERVHPDDLDHAEQSLLHARETLTQFNSEFRIVFQTEKSVDQSGGDVIFAQDTAEAIGMGGQH